MSPSAPDQGPAPDDQDEVVRWRGITRVFPGRQQVVGLNRTDLLLRRGDYVSITGPSGAGKSTLLNVLGLIDTASSGQIWHGGRYLADLSEERRAALRSQDIAFVFQAFHLMENRSVLENVALALTYRGVPRKQREAAALAAVEQVGLEHRTHMPTSVLSGGERQRVALARAFTARPGLLLCDEPTGNLDAGNAAQVLDLLDDLNARGTCVVVVTHDEQAAQRAPMRWRIDSGTLTSLTPRPLAAQGDRPSAAPPPPNQPRAGRARVRLRDLLREGLLPLRDRPGRSLLTSLGVAVGAAAFVMTSGLQATNGQQIRAFLGNLRSTQVTAQVTVPRDQVVSVADVNGWEHGVAASGATAGGVGWRVADTVTVRNVSPASEAVPVEVPVVAAGWPMLQAGGVSVRPGSAGVVLSLDEPVLLVGHGLAAQLQARVGDSLLIGTTRWTVGGFVTDSRLQPDLLLSIVVPFGPALNHFGPPQAVDVLLRSPPGGAADVARRAPAALSPAAPARVLASAVPDVAAITAPIDDQILQAGLGMSLAALVIGMLMTGAAAYVSVLERQGELALRRSLGARPGDIGRQIAVEATATATFGAALGLVAGVCGVLLAAWLRQLPAVLPAGVVAATIPAGIVAGVVAALVPARRANRVDPVTYLRRL